MNTRRNIVVIAPLIVAAAVGLTCGINQKGQLEADQIGDTSRPAERGSPVADLRAACRGRGVLDVALDVITREPYLQQVTPRSAIVGWRSTSAAGERLVVTTPDGQQVADVAALPVAGSERDGATQVWATIPSVLAPATTYCYALHGPTGPRTERLGFRTAPTADDPSTIRVLAFGDSGSGGADQIALRSHMFDVEYDLIIHTGDIAYEDGTHEELHDNHFLVYTDLLRHKPLYPVPGDHDHQTPFAEPYREAFNLPGEETFYAFDWGRIRFVALDTARDPEEMAAFLDAQLARTSLPWRIVYMHTPLYSAGHHGSDLELRARIEPILVAHGVQLVLAGHDHNYERTFPQNGVTYIVTGGGGRGVRGVGRESFTAHVDDVIHYTYLEVGADELVAHAIDATGAEFDSVVIPREPAR